ncbi:beta-propeller fold lactonase family protein, partial [Candidatus Halobeggiatoa sp. HSG11]|nr:beta-propeller fold lactonase family protein [Candidatus Halobeggiatoa sp. HSG11]
MIFNRTLSHTFLVVILLFLSSLVLAAPLTISGVPPDAKVDWSYSFTPTVEGASGNLTFGINKTSEELKGLSFDTSTGTLSGTPTEGGFFIEDIEITVSDNAETAKLVFDINVINVNNTTIDVNKEPTAVAINYLTNKIYVANNGSGNVTVIDGYNNNVIKIVRVGDHPGAIAINPQTNKIYVANNGSGNVTVIDGDSYDVIKTVAVGNHPIAIAINTQDNKIYVANEGQWGDNGTVTVIDANNNKTTTVTVGNRPTAIAINPQNNKIYVTNFASNNVTVIDANNSNATTTVTVGIFPRAIAIDTEDNKIYVVNSWSDNVTVIDANNNNETTTVTVGNRPTAIAINPQDGKIYVANIRNDNVTVIDANNNETTTVAVGNEPIAIAIDTQDNKIYVANSYSDNVTVIDANNNNETTTVTVGNSPTAIAINPQDSKIYVANSYSDNVTVIDTNNNYETTTARVGDNPTAIAIDTQDNKIYVVNSGQWGDNGTVTVIDANNNETTTVTVGNNSRAIAIDTKDNKIYVVNPGQWGDNGTVTVIDADNNNETTTVTVGEEPTAIAIDTEDNKIYVANLGSDNVTVIDANNNETTTVEVGNGPTAIAINTEDNKIYVVNSWSDNVTVIDANNNETTTVEVGDGPTAIAINTEDNKIYVANLGSDNVTVIDANNNNETTTVEVGDGPTAIAINPQDNKIYVANSYSDNITVIDANNNYETTTVTVGDYPTAIAIDTEGNKIYVVNSSSDNITVIDANNNNETTTVTVGDYPTAIAIDTEDNKIYVANSDSDNVTVITPIKNTHPYPLSVNINPKDTNKTSLLEPAIFSLNTIDEITQIYYQIKNNNEIGAWLRAEIIDNKNAKITIPKLRPGNHLLRTFATNEIMETTLNNVTGTNSPFMGETSFSYSFEVITSPIILYNSDDTKLIEIEEDTEEAKNNGTLISELLATGYNGYTLNDGDYYAQEGIAVIAVDDTNNGTWEYSTNGGSTWVAFDNLSETEARLLLIDEPNNRIRFQPNINFNTKDDVAKPTITFYAWDKQEGGGINGGTVDITKIYALEQLKQLTTKDETGKPTYLDQLTEIREEWLKNPGDLIDPYALSPETETASITITDSPEQFTKLHLETSASTILNDDPIDITGKLSVFPATGEDLLGYDIELIITSPDGKITKTESIETNTDIGQFKIEALQLKTLFAGNMQDGAFGLQAKFKGTAHLSESESPIEAVLVGASAGYAILVQGKIQNEEGLAAHNKTIHRIYKKFKGRGFEDDNIKYFNYDTKQEGVDGKPIKADIAAAFTELQERVNSNPAPFYVVMIDHGGIDGTFHIFNSNNEPNDNVITPSELDTWLNGVEDYLATENSIALKKPRLVMLGYCYSGSFISELSQEPIFTADKSLENAGRIIISSATAQEESYKGPGEPDGIRSGEYFMEEFFIRLDKGDNVKVAFEFATEKTEAFTRKGGDANTTNSFHDEATQHPLLDDNGDSKGSNTLSADGKIAETVLFGIGLNYDTNSAENPADILNVNNTIYLGADESVATLEITVNDANSVNSAPVDIRKPTTVLTSTGSETSGQLEIPELQRVFMSCSSVNVCTQKFEKFVEAGMYEAFYFVKDSETNNISPIKRSVIYKNYANNPTPTAFDLIEPTDGSEHKTTLMFKWNSSTDTGGPVTYNFIIAKDSNFTDIAYQQEELETAMTYVDDNAGLKNPTTYYWKVEAVDPFGARTTSSSVFSFNTNNTNSPPGIGSMHISSALDFTPIGGATFEFFEFLDGDGNPLPNPDMHQDQGNYNMLLPNGRRRAKIKVEGYEEQEIDIDTTQGTTRMNVELIPDGGIPKQYGELQFATTTTNIEETIGTATIIVERNKISKMETSDPDISVDYSITNGNTTTGTDYEGNNGTLTWKAKDTLVKAIKIPIINDEEYEEDETFTITLSNSTGGAILGATKTITVTIVDDEAAPEPAPGILQFSNATYSATEGDTTLNLNVERIDGQDGEVSVQYFVNGTSTLDSDY